LSATCIILGKLLLPRHPGNHFLRVSLVRLLAKGGY